MMKTYRYFYDLEILPYNFTNAFVNEEHRTIVVMLYNDSNFEDCYNYDEIHQALQDAYPDYTVRPIMNLNNQKNVDYFRNEFLGDTGRSEWFGWNSKAYDLIIMSAILAYNDANHRMPNTHAIRQWSDKIIVESHRSYKSFYNALVQDGYSENFAKLGQRLYLEMTASQLHVDVGALNEKSNEDTSQSLFPFPLKTMQSYTGIDVIDDDLVKGDGTPSQEAIAEGNAYEEGALTQKGLTQLLVYNINDVIATGSLSHEEEYANALKTKDTLRAEFPFLSKRKGAYGYLYQLSRDATSAQYSAKIILGERNIKPKDMETTSYDFPFKDGVTRNLLDYIEANEANINPRVVEFYRHFENKDTRDKDDYHDVIFSSPTGKSTINIPYVDKNRTCISCYNTASIGGSHGEVINDSYGHKLDSKYDQQWFVNFETRSMKKSVTTVDEKNVIHVDFSSYYPTLNILLGVYANEFEDNYSQVREKRYALKDMLTDELKEKDRAKYDEINRRQNALKLVLNSATGASNQHKPHSDLPLDNATLSMRIMGNLLAYVVGQRFANAGGLVISTNTDGLFIANMTIEEAKVITDDFYNVYGLTLDPELVDRMVNKNSNERIEMVKSTKTGKLEIDGIGGSLSRSLGKRIDLLSKINYPRASGKAVLNYIYDNEMWLHNPINYKLLRAYVIDQLNDFNPIDWTITLKGNNRRHFYTINQSEDVTPSKDETSFFNEVEYKNLQNTNRVILTKNGNQIVQYFESKKEKISGLTSDKVTILNRQSELEDFKSYINDLDIEAYTKWAYNLIKTWHKPSTIPEIDGDKEMTSNQQQLTISDLI